MQGVFAAPAAVFAPLEPRSGLLLIFHRRVVAALAISARKRDDNPIFLLRH
jgi:hypothetical protein